MQSTNLLLRCCKDCTKDAFTFTLLMCMSTNLTPFTPVLNISDIFLLLKRRHCNCTSSAVSLCDIITTWPPTSYEDNEKTESSTEVTSEWIDRSELFLYKHVSCVLGWNDPLNRQYILTWVIGYRRLAECQYKTSNPPNNNSRLWGREPRQLTHHMLLRMTINDNKYE